IAALSFPASAMAFWSSASGSAAFVAGLSCDVFGGAVDLESCAEAGRLNARKTAAQVAAHAQRVEQCSCLAAGVEGAMSVCAKGTQLLIENRSGRPPSRYSGLPGTNARSFRSEMAIP